MNDDSEFVNSYLLSLEKTAFSLVKRKLSLGLPCCLVVRLVRNEANNWPSQSFAWLTLGLVWITMALVLGNIIETLCPKKA